MLEDRPYMRRSDYRPHQTLPGVVVLLIINVVVFLLVAINDASGRFPVFHYFALSRTGIGHGFVWQLLTFQFLHAGLWHLLINMFVLYIFGRAVEDMIGKKDFFALYLASGVAGGLLQLLLGLAFPRLFGASVVGASAGVFGVIAAFSILAPDQQILLFFVLPIRSRYFLWIAAGVSVFSMLVPVSPGVAHAAHLGGLLAGVAYIRWVIQSGRTVTSWLPVRVRRSDDLVRVRFPRTRSRRQAAHAEPMDVTNPDFISQEVDPILDKISAHGMQSLTPRERKILESARSKMERR